MRPPAPGSSERAAIPASVVPGLADSQALLGVLALAVLLTTFLFTLSLVAYRRRRSRPYLLVTAAIGALVLRSTVGVATAYGYVPMVAHHVVEHALDVTIAGLLLAAVSLGATGRRSAEEAAREEPSNLEE